jgi:type IV secretory pathway VirB10-like protein
VIANIPRRKMTEERFENSANSPAHTSEPHFKDDWTLMTARRVVPLEKIEAKVRRRRQWFLGGAFAVAMMLGAASALLASYLRQRSAASSTTELSQIEVPQQVVAAEPKPSATPATETVAEPLMERLELVKEPAIIDETPKRDNAVKRRTVVAREKPQNTREEERLSEDEQLDRVREPVLFDSWQERRARRAARRERRRAERYNQRGLSELDEIFAGPRRP